MVKNKNLGQKMVKNQFFVRNFGQKLKLWSKSIFFAKNRNLGEQLKFWSKIKISVKNHFFFKDLNFCQKSNLRSKFWSKIEMLVRINTFLRPYFGILIPKCGQKWAKFAQKSRVKL